MTQDLDETPAVRMPTPPAPMADALPLVREIPRCRCRTRPR